MALLSTTNELTLGQCLRGLLTFGAQYSEYVVTGIAMDTRQLHAGHIFVAVQGILQHGIAFLDAALDKHPSAVIVQTQNGKPELNDVPASTLSKAKRGNVALLFADINNTVLAELANRVFERASQHCRVIGITGTNGKTSCSHYIAQSIDAIAGTGDKAAIIGTLGLGFYGRLAEATHTTPDVFTVHRSIHEFYKNGATHVVMEVSSHGLDQGRVDGVNFEAAIFTNLTQDHLDYHGSMDEYGLAKKKLFTRPELQVAIINGDDDHAASLVHAVANTVEVIVYGTNPRKRFTKYVQASAVVLKQDGMELQVQSYKGDFDLRCNLMGRFNVSNLLALCAYLLHSGVEIEKIQSCVARLVAVPGRMQAVMHSSGSPLAIVDYAHTPDALEKAIAAVREHLHSGSITNGGRLCVVFGCGGDRDAGKRPLMGSVAAAGADKIILTDDNPRGESPQAIIEDIKRGIAGHPNCSVIHDRRQAIAQAIAQAGENEVILIAGKGHENYQIIGKQKMAMPCDAELAQAALSSRSSAPEHKKGDV